MRHALRVPRGLVRDIRAAPYARSIPTCTLLQPDDRQRCDRVYRESCFQREYADRRESWTLSRDLTTVTRIGHVVCNSDLVNMGVMEGPSSTASASAALITVTSSSPQEEISEWS